MASERLQCVLARAGVEWVEVFTPVRSIRA